MIATVSEVKEILRISADDVSTDDYIAAQIPIVQDFILDFTNNRFANMRVVLISTAQFSGNEITVPEGLVESMFVGSTDIVVVGSYHNDNHFTVDSDVAITDTVITVEEDLIDEDTDNSLWIAAVNWPKALKQTLSNMVYSQMNEDVKKGIQSKTFETFTVTYNGGQVDASGYMKNDLRALHKYRKIKK